MAMVLKPETAFMAVSGFFSEMIRSIVRPDKWEGGRAMFLSMHVLTRRTPLAIRLVCMIVWAYGLCAAASAELDEPMPADFMPSSEIRPGMRGVGRTVIQGYDLTEFDVEILGVQTGAIAGSSMILAKLSAPWLENHGVVAGMSGSPVFIDGRLIGAVAYGWSGSYKPYGGITPIEDMWTIWRNIGRGGEDPPDETGIFERREGWDMNRAWEAYEAQFEGPGEAREPMRFDGVEALRSLSGGMVPLSAPLFASGAPPETLRRLDSDFRALGMDGVLPMGAGAGGEMAHDGVEPPLIENGSALAVPLVRGDLNLSGTGTVTYCRGDRLIAFGHPMFFNGPVGAPMARSFTFGIMQSYGRSFKLSGLRDTVGTIDQDRRFGIGGRLGEAPATVPMTVTVGGAAASRPRDYHYEIWESATMLPRLASSAMNGACEASVSQGGRMSVEAAYTVELADGRCLERRSVLTGDGALGRAVSSGLTRDLALLMGNPFRRGDVARIDASFKFERGVRIDELIECRTQYKTYEPGETVTIQARFRGHRRGYFDREYRLGLPGDLADGTYVIHLVDASGAASVDSKYDPSRFVAHNYDELVEALRVSDYSEDILSLYLFAPECGVEVWDGRFSGAPGSMQDVISSTAPREALDGATGRLVSRQMIDYGMTVTGNRSMAIDVARRKGP